MKLDQATRLRLEMTALAAENARLRSRLAMVKKSLEGYLAGDYSVPEREWDGLWSCRHRTAPSADRDCYECDIQAIEGILKLLEGGLDEQESL